MAMRRGLKARLDRLEAAEGKPGVVHVFSDQPRTPEEIERLIAESGKTRGVIWGRCTEVSFMYAR